MAFKVVDLNSAIQFLDKAQDEIDRGDITPSLGKCKVALSSSIKMNFANGRGPDGTVWPALRMARPRGGNKPLRDRDILMASATATGAVGHIEKISPTSLVYGTNVDYARTHQDGATIVGRPALAFPLTREAYNAGRARRFPRTLSLVWPRGDKAGFLVEKKKRGKPIRQYRLVRSVRIPARPFIGWNDALATTCGNIIAEDRDRKIGGL